MSTAFRVAPVKRGDKTFKVEIVSNVASALSNANAMSDLKCRYEVSCNWSLRQKFLFL